MIILAHPYLLTQRQSKNNLRRTLLTADKENCKRFKIAMQRILQERFGDKPDIVLEVFFKNGGGHKINYSNVQNLSLRKEVKEFVQKSYPIVC